MSRFLFATTARQVGWVVALATISSNAMVIAVWLVLSPGSFMPGSIRALAAEVVGVVEVLRHAPESIRPLLIAAARQQSLDIELLPSAALEGTRDRLVARALDERLAQRGIAATAEVVVPEGTIRQGIRIVIAEAGGGPAWGVAVPRARMQLAIPSVVLPPTTILLLLGVPLLLVLLWMAWRITRPLARLAQAADAVGAAGHQVALPVAGTSEIRRVVHAINGLLARLRDDAAERALIMAGISHDLRTPLTRLMLRIETLSDPEVRRLLNGDLNRMEAIVHTSLTLFEVDLQQEVSEVIDVAALASTVCDQFADAGRDAAYDGPLHLVIHGQPIGLERALTNLVDNACRHAGSARLLLREVKGAVRIAVQDQGPGIAEIDLPHITAAYRRRRNAQVGHGLGLAIVASVARAHGGTLALRNLAPRGLCAELSLPALNAA